MAVGPRALVAAQPRLAPVASLLSMADVVPNAGLPADPSNPQSERDANVLRWLNGIHYRPNPCGLASISPVGCATGDANLNPGWTTASADRSEVTTDPIMVWADETCSTYGWSENEYVARARGLLEASEAYKVEQEFWTGTQAKAGTVAGANYPDDQWLAQTNTATVISGTAVSPGRALGLLQQALGDCAGGGVGMIHLPAYGLSDLLTLALVTPVTGRPTTQFIDGRGNYVVPGFGYKANTSPAGVAAGPGEKWVYATGMVRIWRSDIVVTPETFAEATDRTHNNIEFRASRYYLVDWDRCCHFAILVSDCDCA